jgi:hypothetical protein
MIDPNKVILDSEQSDAIIGAQAAEIRRLRLTDEEREAIEAAATLASLETSATYNENNEKEKKFWDECKKVLRLFLERTK